MSHTPVMLHADRCCNAVVFTAILLPCCLPVLQSLQDAYEGFLGDQFVSDYVYYADALFKAFGDRIKHWITFNEPWVTCTLQVTGCDQYKWPICLRNVLVPEHKHCWWSDNNRIDDD